MAQVDQVGGDKPVEQVAHLRDFHVIEFRRYNIQEGGREMFAQYFEAYFPEAFQQIGAIAAGSFFERDNNCGFTWIRAFHTIEDRAVANTAFYYGPLWKEHRSTINGLMTAFDNVLLLRPLRSERAIPVLPAVDPVREPEGAQGVVVAHIFPLKREDANFFLKEAEATFAAYLAAGAREAGVLVTLDVPNNFPQHPVRTDGHYFVWLGILKHNQALHDRFLPVAERFARSLAATGLLREEPELLVLDPTPRSRLRWYPDDLNASLKVAK